MTLIKLKSKKKLLKEYGYTWDLDFDFIPEMNYLLEGYHPVNTGESSLNYYLDGDPDFCVAYQLVERVITLDYSGEFSQL